MWTCGRTEIEILFIYVFWGVKKWCGQMSSREKYIHLLHNSFKLSSLRKLKFHTHSWFLIIFVDKIFQLDFTTQQHNVFLHAHFTLCNHANPISVSSSFLSPALQLQKSGGISFSLLLISSKNLLNYLFEFILQLWPHHEVLSDWPLLLIIS